MKISQSAGNVEIEYSRDLSKVSKKVWKIFQKNIHVGSNGYNQKAGWPKNMGTDEAKSGKVSSSPFQERIKTKSPIQELSVLKHSANFGSNFENVFL